MRCETVIEPPLDNPVIHPLPHTTLNIHFFNFVGQMSLPALLTLEYADLSELSLPPLLLNFLVRSQISLQKFVFTFHNMHHTHSGNILHILLPSLTESGVHYTCILGVTNDILCRLTTFPRQLAEWDVRSVIIVDRIRASLYLHTWCD